MGTIKKVGDKSYSQNAKGDWYEVESPVQQEPENAKVINGVTYYKDDAGDWYEGEKVSQKKNDGKTSEIGGQEPKTGGVSQAPSPSLSKLQEEKPKTREQVAKEDLESQFPFLTEKIKINQPGDVMTGQQRQQMAASKVKSDKLEEYRTQELPKQAKAEKEKAKQASLKPQLGEQFNPIDFATNDIATYSGGASLSLDPKAPSKDKFHQLNQFFGNDASNVAPYFENRTKAVDKQISQIKQNAPLWRALNQGKSDIQEIEKLKDYKLKLAAASNKLATDYTAWLYPDESLERKGEIKRKLAGDGSVNQEIAFKEKGIPLTDEQKFNNAKQGVDVERTRLENDYRDVPPDQRDDVYYQRLAQVNNMDEKLLNQFPDYKKSQVAMMVAQLASQDKNIDASMRIGFVQPELDQETINYISDKYKIPKEDLAGITYGDIPKETIASNLYKGVWGLGTGLATGATRILGTMSGVDSDRLTYLNNKISGSGDYLFGENPYENTSHPQSIIDINPTSSTYLQSIPNPKAGKSNYNLASVSNAIAEGAGSFAGFIGGLKLATKGVQAAEFALMQPLTAEAEQSAAMATYMILHGYENNWQRGNQVLGKDASEAGKAMYATLSGYIDKLAFDVLPKDKLFLNNEAKTIIDKEVSPYLKNLTIKDINKEVLQTKVQKAIEGIVNTAKEVGHITAATSAAEISKGIVNSIVGEGKPKEYMNEAWQGVKHTIVETPLSMALPLGLMEVVKAKQHSSFFKENVYSAGLEPNKYISLIQQELGKGNITPDEAASRMEVVRTMHYIVQSTPDINPLTNKQFTHSQQVDYAYNRLKETGLRAKALAHADDPTISSIYLRDAEDLADVRKAMLESFSKEPKQPEVIKEKTIPQQKVDIERQRQDELEKTPEEADKINAKYDAEIAKLSEQEELPSEKTIEEIIPQEQLEKTQSVMDRVGKNENINEGELKEAEDILYTTLADNPKSAHLIEPLIKKLESHENITKTETVQTTEREPIEGTLAAKRKIEIKPVLEQSEGSTARVTLADGTTGEGTLKIKDGNYVIEVEGQEPIVVGEKAITDRDLKVPEGESPVELDENGNVKSATFETKDGHKVTITDPEKALDLGIQLSLETVGEIPDEAFDRVYEDVIKEDKIEVPIEKPKVVEKVKLEAEIPKEGEAEAPEQKEKKDREDTQSKLKNLSDEKFEETKKKAGYNVRDIVDEESIAKDYHDALKIPEPERTEKQNKIVEAVNEALGTKKRGKVTKGAKGKAAKFVAEHIEEPTTEGEPKPEPSTEEKSGEEILKELDSKGTKSSDEKSLNELADKHKGNKIKRKIIEQARKAIKTLKSVFPNMDIHLHENEQDFNDVMDKIKSKKGTGGNFAYTKNADGTYSGRIDINLDKANLRTIAHEVTHAVLFKAFGENQELFQSFRDKISKVLGSATDKNLQEFADNPFYKKTGVTAEEYLSELSGLLSSKTISPLTLSKIASAINEFVSKITGGKFIPFENVNDAKDVVEFFDKVSNAIKKGNDLTNIGKERLVEITETQARIKSKSQTEKLFKADKDEIEKILDKAGKNKEGKKWKLSDVATVISKYIDKKKVFDKPIEEVSDKEFVSGIKKETEKELNAWEESVGGKEYVSFYKNDITDRLNPKLQQFAEKRYGRKLTPEEISLYHLVSAFASPEATPEFDSSKGLEVFDKYMKTGNLSGLSDKQATIWALNEKGVKEDTGVQKFTESGEPVMSKWSKGYADYSLNKFKKVIDYFNGDLGKAIDWAQSIHSYEEISNVMGTPLSGAKKLEIHENLSKENGGFGIFGFTGAKLGSYALNRMGEYSTVTKDMWYARTMARLSGESMFDEKGDAVKRPWAFTVEDVRKRKLADKAWEDIAKKKGLSPSDIQERMWDYEKRLWEKLGAVESASYASDGFMKQAKVFEPDIKFLEPAPEQKIKSKLQFEDEKGLPLTDETKKYEQQPKSTENTQGREGIPKSVTAGKTGAREERPRNAESYSNPDGTPQYVVKRSDRDGGKRLDISVNGTPSKAKAVYTQSEQLKSAVNNYRNAYTDKNLIELDDPKLFHKLITQSKSINEFGASVHVYEPGEYAQMRLFITPDGKAGVALKPDGDLVSGFSNQEVDKPRRIAQLLGLAIKEGATKADSFDTVLPQYYLDFGLIPVAQDKWNEQFKPEKWDKEVFKRWNNGEPDVIYYVYKGGDRSTISERAGEFGSWKDLKKDVPYAEYDDAIEIQEQKVKENDTKNITGLPSKVGEGKEPIPAESKQGAGAEKTSTGGVLQAPGAEGEGKAGGKEVSVSELPQQKGEGVGEVISKSQMPMDKKVSDMKDILKEYVDEGKSLDEIKDILKDEFGDYYKDVERIIEQAHQEMITTGIKNAITERERSERGLAEVEVEAKRSFGKVFDTANEMINNKDINGLTLAAEIVKNPRPLKAEESAVLLIDRMRISKEYSKRNTELLEAQKNGETDKADIIQSQMEALEEEMDLNDEAAKKSGYEQGLGLAARRMLIAQDYSLVTQMNRLKAANGGKEVPKQYQEQLQTLITQLEEANNKLEKFEKTQSGTEKQKEVSKVKPVSRTPEQTAKEKESIKSKIVSKWGKTLSRMKATLKGKSQIVSKSAISPEKQSQLESIVKDVNDMVKLYAEGGETNLKKIIDNIHNDLAGEIPDLEKTDVEDIVLGKYDTERVKTPLTPEKIQALANVRKVKTQIDMLKEELKNKQRGGVEKAVDYLHGWHRFSILSGVPSAAKIGTAALTRGIVTRGENIVGQALSLIPGIRKIAKQAPREGGFSRSAESKAFSSWFDKMTRDDMAEVMSTGISQIDYLYGAKEPKAPKVPEWMEFFGRMHSAIKLLPKRAEFFRSLEMRTEQALKEGKDINDAVVQQELGVAAYNDALRAIFMQENILTENYQAAIRKYEQTQPTTASLLKFLFPIVKVPSNYVAEQSSYIPVVAAVKAITALYKGRKGMTPEQADFFMRALKKGSIGTAFIALGFFNPGNLGGYYTGKRKKDDLEAGDIELFGVKLPHFMLHTPLLEMLQVGATMRRAAESQLAKGEEPSKTLGMYTGGIPAVLKGQLTQIPFIGTGERTMKLLENKTADGIKEFANSMVQSIVEPQLMQNLADYTDTEEGKTVKRESKGLVEKLKEGAPGFRKTLKQDKSKFTDKEYEEFSNITEKGLNIPELNKRTTYKVKIDTEHPDGHMTEDEYDKFIPLQKEYVKDAYKKYYSTHKSDFDKLQKMVDAVPETPEEKAKMNALKDDIQNKIDNVHNEAIKAAKRKLGLHQK